MRVLAVFLRVPLLLVACWPVQQALADSCTLLPMAEQLLIPELRVDDPQQAERGYRRRVLRFTNDYYSNIAQDILRGDGEYLLALQRLMGSSGSECVQVYRQLLVQEVNSHDFGLALWTFRMSTTAQTLPTQDWGVVTEEK